MNHNDEEWLLVCLKRKLCKVVCDTVQSSLKVAECVAQHRGLKRVRVGHLIRDLNLLKDTRFASASFSSATQL